MGLLFGLVPKLPTLTFPCSGYLHYVGVLNMNREQFF